MRKLLLIVACWAIAQPLAAQEEYGVQEQPVRDTWVRVSNGNIPANAFPAGNEANGFTLYIARVQHEGSRLTGKTGQGWSWGYFPYGGKEIGLEGYEVFTGSGRWQTVPNGGRVPANAIRAGHEANGQPLYIARAAVEGGYHIGKARDNVAFIPYGGEEKVFNSFQVLVSGNAVGTTGNLTPAGSRQTGTIRIEDIDEWLCPNNLTRGDREFDGNGPRIKTEVRLRVGNNGTALYADITFWAQETKHDWSTAEGRWTRKVYDAPYGKTIRRIVSDQASRTQFLSPPAGAQFSFPGHDVANAVNGFLDGLGGGIAKTVFALHGIPSQDLSAFSKLITAYSNHGNTAVRVPATEGTLVRFFTIVGDTGGDDISHDDNCNDDTRIVKIEFAPVEVEWAN